MANVGRPTDYTEELAAKICNEIATQSKGLETICRENPDFPTARTIHYWAFKNESFFQMYMQARRFQTHKLMDKCLDVAEDDEEDTLIKINRARVKIDTYKHNATRLNPETYSERSNKISADDKKSLVEQLIDKL